MPKLISTHKYKELLLAEERVDLICHALDDYIPLDTETVPLVIKEIFNILDRDLSGIRKDGEMITEVGIIE